MKIALLSADAETALLANAFHDLRHEITWIGDSPGFPGEDRVNNWEELCDPQICDAILIGRGQVGSQLKIERLLQLVKCGRPVLCTFPLNDSVLNYYELDMARTESSAVLCHFNPLLEDRTAVETVANFIRAGHPTVGPIEQVHWERPLSERSQVEVFRHFARDVELLDRLAGPIDRLGAIGSSNTAATYSGLSVQLLGKCPVPIHWSVGPVEDSALACLTLVGTNGRSKFLISDEGNWSPSLVGISSEATHSAARNCVERFVAALEKRGDSTTWPSALRAMELADTIEISLRRGRIIDVHRQQLTEQLSFRGTMSALGCGVLLLLPPLLIVAGWLAGQLGLPIAEYWAHGLLALLSAFLLIQLVPKLFFKSKSSDTKDL